MVRDVAELVGEAGVVQLETARMPTACWERPVSRDGPGRRAQRGDVEVGELEAAGGERVDVAACRCRSRSSRTGRSRCRRAARPPRSARPRPGGAARRTRARSRRACVRCGRGNWVWVSCRRPWCPLLTMVLGQLVDQIVMVVRSSPMMTSPSKCSAARASHSGYCSGVGRRHHVGQHEALRPRRGLRSAPRRSTPEW